MTGHEPYSCKAQLPAQSSALVVSHLGAHSKRQDESHYDSCDDGLGLVRAVKPCASRTALRLRGLTAQPAQAGWAFMCNARACDDTGMIRPDTVRRVTS